MILRAARIDWLAVRSRQLVLSLAAAAMAMAAGCGGQSQGHRTSAPPRVSGPLIGVTFDGPVLSPGVDFNRQLSLAVASGAESLRVAVDWSRTQPYRSDSAVPAGFRSQFQDVNGIPTHFSALDRVVAAAASRGVSLLPVVEYTPSWDSASGKPNSPPRTTGPFATFLRALIRRYGSGGSFWATHPSVPRLPIRMWQIWNEPNFASYWSEQPFAKSYARLLAVAHATVKAADPGAKVVLAGFADFSWQYLAALYRVPGAEGLFDIVAVHPYTAKPAGVLTILQRVRAVMDRNGDAGKPMLATEITWPSSAGKAPPQFGVGVTEAQQARLLGRVIPLLLADRAKLKLMGFYWYTWMGNETPHHARYGFDYAGLLKYISGRVLPKPALAVFRSWALRIEGCRRKTAAQSCA